MAGKREGGRQPAATAAAVQSQSVGAPDMRAVLCYPVLSARLVSLQR